MVGKKNISRTEIANEIGPQSIRGPLAVCYVAISIYVEAELLSALAESIQTTFSLVDSLDPSQSMAISASKGFPKWGQPRIKLHDT